MLDRILCLHEKYCLFDESGTYSACNLIIHQTVEAAVLSKDVKVFYYDIQKKIGIHGMIRSLLQEIKNYRPDAIIFFVPFEEITPLGVALQYIREQYGTRIIAFYSDSLVGLVWPGNHRVFKYYSKMADAIICIDSTSTRVIYDHHCNIQGHPTVDLRLFKPAPGIEKDIDVLFVGSIACGIYGSRKEYLEYIRPKLEEKGYQLYTGGGMFKQFGEKSVSQAEYIELINRSKIVLNFSRTYADFRQMKGRLLEAMACRAFVMTENCPSVGKFFKEGIDYISFDHKTELIDKLLYYLERDSLREQIAASAYIKMTRLYNPRNVWGYIFKKLGFDMTGIYNDDFKEYEKRMDEIQKTIDITYPSLHNSEYIVQSIEKKQYYLAAHLAMVRLNCFPLDADSWFYLGESLFYQGQYGAAYLAFERCSLLDPLTKRKHTFLIDSFHINEERPVAPDLEKLLKPPVGAFVTAVVITKNNESTLERCLKSLLDAVDRVVVVDLGSQDHTAGIVRQYKQADYNVVLLELESATYQEALLIGIQQPGGQKNQWVFHVNPDEYLFSEDKEEVKLTAALFSGRNVLLNVLSKPVLLKAISNESGDNFTVAPYRLFPVKNGIVLTHLGVAGDACEGMTGQTVKIRLQYDLLQGEAGEQ